MVDEQKKKKHMRIMLIGLGILFGLIFLYKIIGGYFFKKYMRNQTQVITVSAMNAKYSDWQSKLTASGSLRAINGVDVTTELAGMVETIHFDSGAIVKKDEVLVQLKASSDLALLRSLQANAALALLTYNRDKAQYAIHGISKATLDNDFENLKSANAQVDQQQATVNKKTIRAPFDGRLGISAIDLGQYLNPGDKIVTLQQLNPIYADFFVPQQSMVQLTVGIPVEVMLDAFPGKVFNGKITTINPIVDSHTRNVEVEATIDNSKNEIFPGMFATVKVAIGKPQRYLTLPQTAISYNPYGEIIYIIKRQGKDKENKPILKVNQVFVTTGDTRGDQIAILSGLKEGDAVVTSGQLKLKNNSQIVIDNKIAPSNMAAPQVTNE